MSDQHRFSDRLVAAEKVDNKLKERYEMEMQKMLNTRLSPLKRTLYAIIAVASAAAAISCGHSIMAVSGGFANVARATGAVLAALFVALAVVTGRVAIKGRANARRDNLTIARIKWGISMTIAIVLMFITWLDVSYNDGKESAFYAAIAIAFLILGAVHLIRESVAQSGLSTREKLLEIQLKLDEVSRKLDGGE